MILHELQQVIWLDTPKGLCLAKFLVDRGIDSDLEWITFHNETGQVLSFDNSDVLVCKSFTLARRTDWEKFSYQPRKKRPVISRPPRSMARLPRGRK